jgi:hypothetical protein
MKSPFTGGCQCGAVRYECTADESEIQMFKCHCRDCQRMGGGPYAAVVYVPARTFKLTRGAIQHHFTPGEAAPHQRGFCARCGSRLTGGEGPGSTGIGMTAASLDEPSQFQPQFEMWISDAQAWDRLEPDIPHYDKYPPGP